MPGYARWAAPVCARARVPVGHRPDGGFRPTARCSDERLDLRLACITHARTRARPHACTHVRPPRTGTHAYGYGSASLGTPFPPNARLSPRCCLCPRPVWKLSRPLSLPLPSRSGNLGLGSTRARASPTSTDTHDPPLYIRLLSLACLGRRNGHATPLPANTSTPSSSSPTSSPPITSTTSIIDLDGVSLGMM